MKRILFPALAALLLLSHAVPAADAQNTTRIALLSDIHMHGTNEAQKILHQKRFDLAIAAVNAANVDLVLMAGDLTEHGIPEEMSDFKSQLKRLRAPVWFVPGNHEIGNKIIPGKEEKENRLTERRLARFESRWGSSFFVRELNGLRVVGVNAPICSSGFPREKKMWNFLENKLAVPSEKTTIVLLHFPPFTKNASEPGGAYWNLEPFPRQRLLSLIRQANVKAVLSGHMHTESMSRYDGVLYVTSPPVAFGLPKGKQKQKEGWTLVTVSADGDVQAEFRYLQN